MTLKKAIEILTYWDEDLNKWNEADTDTAVKLGIEALKWFHNFDKRGGKGTRLLLPGETKE